MPQFEPRRLETYDRESLIRELVRVAALVSGTFVTLSNLKQFSNIGATTFRRHFGSWREALEAAGLGHRYDESNQPRSAEEILTELRRVADLLGTKKLGRRQFGAHSHIKEGAVTSVFGTWAAAVEAAGLRPNFVRDPSIQQCFENLLSVWTYYGRQPSYAEMGLQPSRITGKVYARKWSSWSKAVRAFAVYANTVEDSPEVELAGNSEPASVVVDTAEHQGPRMPPLRLRYRVLVRDRFRCVLCGASPATHLPCDLHVDHITPYSHGGRTELANLRTLCAPCNLGKGSLVETSAN